MGNSKKTNNKNLSRCTGSFQIREVKGDGNERKRILSFSSDTPYKRWFGLEILAHDSGCVDLSRLNEIGVLLFNHDRDAVVGKILRAWIEDGRGMAEVEFDTDEKSDVVFQKVTNGTLKGVSVGYTVDNWEEVANGSTSSNGKYPGPCSVAVKWTPLEISIVSVPADATVGVDRDVDNFVPEKLLACERQLQVNKNFIKKENLNGH